MSQLLHRFLWFCRKKHMQDLVWCVITHLCHARTHLSSFCNNVLSFKGVRAQAAQLSQRYGSDCVTPAMPCLCCGDWWILEIHRDLAVRMNGRPVGNPRASVTLTPSQPCHKSHVASTFLWSGISFLFSLAPSTVVLSTFGIASANTSLCNLSC